MLGLKKVAITGGLASGKSAVCAIFKELGAYVVDADAIVHQMLSPKTSVGQKVIALLTEDILVNGQIDRKKIADKVFSNRSLLYSLQELLHPAVMLEIESIYQSLREQRIPLFVAEIPLLFESGGERFFDVVIAVNAEPEVARKRFHMRANIPESELNREYEIRMSHQLPLEEKGKRADLTIDNSGSRAQLRSQVVEIYHKLLN